MFTGLELPCRKLMNSRGILFAVLAGVAILTFSGRAVGDHPGQGGRPLEAVLTGDAEVPGPGHAEAEGSALLRLNPGQQEVCFDIEFEGINPADPSDRITAGHIHVGSADVAGSVVVSFQIAGPLPVDGDGRGSVTGCVSANRDLIRKIIKNPGDYYVNLHSPNFPAGAIRGQLSK